MSQQDLRGRLGRSLILAGSVPEVSNHHRITADSFIDTFLNIDPTEVRSGERYNFQRD